MRNQRAQCLALLANLLLFAAGAQAAISFKLNSIDYPVYADEKMSMKEYAVLQGGNGACLLLSLDNGLGGVVRFTYASNVSNVHWRSDVVVSVHRPSVSQFSMAVLDKVDAVIQTKLFNAEELARLHRPNEVVGRGTERQEIANAGAEVKQQSQSTTVSVRPAQDGTGPAAKFIDGHYAVCFHLLRSKAVAQKPPSMQYEQVKVQLIEVVSTRHSTSLYIARLNDNAANLQNGDETAGGAMAEMDREYAKMIRSLFRASSTTDLRTLLNQDDLVTSEELKSRLEDMKALQKQLFGLYHGFEYLENRFQRMRATAEATFNRIWICMVVILAVMGGTTWFTFHYTKGLIIKRKLI
ncbi:emp24/gp25L/p24 family/GOLD, putative [Leishmania lindenbergi]|uniref:Emp24/gp25L/p24 family/GOLD n=1 Tax=Leishmania lindenbergi TaxID=651832 RepID=A0AAW3AIL5_9TRYP